MVHDIDKKYILKCCDLSNTKPKNLDLQNFYIVRHKNITPI